jgi:hypothetical protein
VDGETLALDWPEEAFALPEGVPADAEAHDPITGEALGTAADWQRPDGTRPYRIAIVRWEG